MKLSDNEIRDITKLLEDGRVELNLEERKKIIESLKFVDEVFTSIDKDKSVCKSLEAIKPDIFAKGGDRTVSNIPEADICNKHHIEIIDGLGEKLQSSSELVKKIKK